MSLNLKYQLTRKLTKLSSGIAPNAVGSFYARLFCTPRRTQRPNWEVELLNSATRSWQVNGCQCWEWGKGPTIVLIHGWEGRGSQLGKFVSPLVEAGFRVVTWDAPAHGDSSGRSTNLVQNTSTLLEIAKNEGPIYGLIAHSLGGNVARLAVGWGLKVERVVQIASPFRVQTIFSEFIEHTQLSKKAAAAFQEKVERVAGVAVSDIDQCMILSTDASPECLVIHCDHDYRVRIEEGESFVAHAPDKRHLHRVTRLGHRRILMDHDVVTSVRSFMADSRFTLG